MKKMQHRSDRLLLALGAGIAGISGYEDAIQDQLGLKLKATMVSMDTLVIDVERPKEN